MFRIITFTKNLFRLCPLSVLMIILFAHPRPVNAATEFYVAPAVAPTKNVPDGSQAHPLPGLESARNTIRALKAKGGLPAGGVTVWLRGGDYTRSQSFTLTAQDSGTPAAPIVYAAAPGEKVSLVGGAVLDPTWFTPVTAQSPVWDRLDPAARGPLLQADLKAHGFSDYGRLLPRGFGQSGAPAALELFMDGQALPLARWPNEGFEKLVTTPAGQNGCVFTYAGDRPARWAKAADPWVFGYFVERWADSYRAVSAIDPGKKTITLATNPCYGVKPKANWFALNLLEEIDRPGEWYLDRAAGILYLWPPAPLAGKRLLASVLEGEMVKLSGASFITLRGLTLEACRGMAVRVDRGEKDLIENCTIRDTGTAAVDITGGRDCGVNRCEITVNGAGGVRLSGGNRAELIPAGHFVTNCRIHDFSRWCRTYVPAVSLQGVGCRAAHNVLYDAPHFAMSYGGNEHLIEYNEIHNVCEVTDDAGTIYTGRDWAVRGNMIRYNFFHDVGSVLSDSNGVHGIYFDDCASGNTAFGNVFYKIGTFGVMIGGGRDNVVENNIFIQCGKAAVHIDDRHTWFTEKPGDSWNLREKIQRLGYDRPPWSTKYPALAAIMKDGYDEAKRPQGDRLVRNIGYKNSAWIHESPKGTALRLAQQDNVENRDPLFVDEAGGNLALKKESPALQIPGFQPIPFDKIGIEK